MYQTQKNSLKPEIMFRPQAVDFFLTIAIYFAVIAALNSSKSALLRKSAPTAHPSCFSTSFSLTNSSEREFTQ